jgi:dTMP kinase
LLYEYLKGKGRKVVYLREPGATKVSEKIRGILLDARNDAMHPECEMLLYMAARAQIVAEIIKPKIDNGVTVLCDRFLDSTIAYQGYGLGMDVDFIKCVGRFATFGIKPDLTIFLDLPVDKGLFHRRGCKDRIEKRSLAYHKRVRNGYLSLAKREPERFKIIRVEEDKNRTQDKIRQLLSRYAI